MKITFSNRYQKLHNQTSATLIAVYYSPRERMSEKFIEYDTTYKGGKYPLPKGQYMILLFLGCDFIPFTTVRRYTPEKADWYKDNINHRFEIEYDIKEEKKDVLVQTNLLEGVE
jgi:hypothetical protein